jgi:hopene-associated glycosyltransferase HpnB
MTELLAVLSLAIWIYLLLFRGFFWRTDVAPVPASPPAWPRIAAIVPARDEASSIARSISSLLAQDYPGGLSVVLVDDHSSDGTAEIARETAAKLGKADTLRIVAARDLPPGWTGKLWALAEGVRAADAADAMPELYLFTDADIAHHPRNLAELTARLEAEQLDLASLMVRLNCSSAAERFLIPAFVYFFAMLYPFAWSNDKRKRTAAAAGGCMLIRASAYACIGGYQSIRGELIDDCALAAAVKRQGRTWLGLSRDTLSLRAYPNLKDIWDMIARTAYTQLDYSPWRLAGTVFGLGLVFLVPPLLLVFAHAPARWLGGIAWAIMALSYVPMLRFYRRNPLRAPLLPAVALVYLAATMDSAWRYWRGKGGLWKGRVSWQSQR